MSRARRPTVLFVLKTSQGGMWIIPQLEAFQRRGFVCQVIIPAADGRLRRALAAMDDVEIISSPFSFSFRPSPATLKGLWQLRRLIASRRPDVMVYHLYASALAARLSSFGLRIPRVHMVAGPLYLESPVIRVAESALMSLDTVLISGSAFTWDAYEALSGLGPKRHAVLPYGVDSERFREDRSDAASALRASLELSDDTFVAIMVAYTYAPKTGIGISSGIKGHDILLEAWSRFLKAHPRADVRLIIVGSGFDEAGEAHRRRLIDCASPGVTWIDTVDDVRDYYALADVSISPSLSENHGAALEAGATSTPQIVSDAGGLPETVTPSTGWVYPRESISELTVRIEEAYREHHTGELSRRGERAREFISKHFDAQHSAAQVAQIASALISPRRESWTFVSEAHFARTGDGRVISLDGVNGDSAWGRYSSSERDLSLVARSVSLSAPANGEPLTVADLRSLPEYSGIRGLALQTPKILVRLARAVRTPGLLILRLPGPLSLTAALISRLLRRPYAVELVGDIEGVLGAGIGNLPRPAIRVAVAATRSAVDHATAVRYVTEESLQQKYPSSALHQIGFSDVQIDPGDFREGPCSSSAPIRIISVGSQANRYKGHHDIIESLRILRERGHDATLVLVGHGVEQTALVDVARVAGVSDAVIFAGSLNRADVFNALREATVYVQASYTEGLPRAMVEAMSQGLPVVGTSAGGIPELVSPRFLVEPGDATALASAIEEISARAVWEVESVRSLLRAQDFSLPRLSERFNVWLRMLEDANNP